MVLIHCDHFGISHWSLDSQRLPGHLSRWFLRVSEGRLQRSSEEQWAGVCQFKQGPLCSVPAHLSLPQGHCSPLLGSTPHPITAFTLGVVAVWVIWASLLPDCIRSLRREKYVLLHFCNSYTIKHLASVFICISVIYNIYLFMYLFTYPFLLIIVALQSSVSFRYSKLFSYFFRVYSIIGYNRILNTTLCAIQ